MKKILLLISIIFINFNISLAQDIFDPPKLDTVANGSMINRSNVFKLGWNWGNHGKKLDDALNINLYHDVPNSAIIDTLFTTDKSDNILGIEIVPHVSGNKVSDMVINAMALGFEPSFTTVLDSNLRYLDYE